MDLTSGLTHPCCQLNQRPALVVRCWSFIIFLGLNCSLVGAVSPMLPDEKNEVWNVAYFIALFYLVFECDCGRIQVQRESGL